jgi:DNA-binding NtrC family response regulator
MPVRGIQPCRKGGGEMSESLMDWLMTTDHTPARQNTILLVEDEERVRLALHSFLQRRGYEVIGAGTVEEAGQCIRGRGSENIAVIVSDLNLHPDSTGHEGYKFFQRWTAEYPDLPFILMSGDHTVCDLPAIRSGAVRLLVNPFNVYDLLAAVRSALLE